MDLQKLFEAQKVLRNRIDYNKSDRFNKLILALLVELGECANEWRGFKFWSKDQEPKLTAKCNFCSGEGKGYFSGNVWTGSKEECTECLGTGINENENPLLEEFVDGLHFVLELGLESDCKIYEIKPNDCIKFDNITVQFSELFKWTLWVEYEKENANHYSSLFKIYLGLGEMLGFSWGEIEQAYFEKNKINHLRQDSGY